MYTHSRKLHLYRKCNQFVQNMKMNLFYGYSDCNPKDTTLEQVFQLITQDASVKKYTERHRYYLSRNLAKEASQEKAGSICFSVATLFAGGKTQKYVVGCRASGWWTSTMRMTSTWSVGKKRSRKTCTRCSRTEPSAEAGFVSSSCTTARTATG